MNDALTPARAGRLATVDALRGVAAMGVVFHHVYVAQFAPEMPPALAWIAGHAWVGVPIFFVISGYVIPKSLNSSANAGVFLGRRVIRVGMPMMAAAVVAYLCWDVVSSHWSGKHDLPLPALDVAYVACHATATCAIAGMNWVNPVFWTLAIEFQFYLLVAVMGLLALHAPRWIAIIPAVAMLALAPLADKVFLPYHAALFALGTWAWWREQFAPETWRATALFAALVALVAMTHGWTEIIASAVAALVIAFVSWAPRSLLWLGGISYSIYLIHLPVVGRVADLFGSNSSDPWRFQVIALAAILASIACAWLFWRAVEVPALAWSRRIGARAAVA